MQSESTRSYRITPGVATHSINQETVVVNIDTGDYHIFNRTGGFIWSKILEQQEEFTIAKQLVEKFDVNIEEATNDINNFFINLREAGLISQQH